MIRPVVGIFVGIRIAVLALAVSGCNGLPSTDADRSFPIPERWRTSADAQPASSDDLRGTSMSGDASDTADTDRRWWTAFDDAELTARIEQAQARNLDGEAAGLRIEKAEALRQRAALARSPQPSAALRRDWERTSRHGHETQARVTLDYELDIWGRRAADERAAAARWEALRLQQTEVSQRIAKEVAQWHWRRAALEREGELADEDIADADRRLALIQQRFALGAVDASAVALASERRAALRVNARAIRQRREAASDALSVLLASPSLDRNGPDAAPASASAPAPASAPASASASASARKGAPWIVSAAAPSPALVSQLTAAAPKPLAPLPVVAANIPAAVVAQRADVQASDWRLRAALAESDATRTRFYPRITLTGALGTISNDLLRLLSHPVSTLTSELTLPFIAWRDRRNRMLEADVDRRLAINAFGITLYRALAEVEAALSKEARFAREDEERAQMLTDALQRERVSDAQYRAGQTDIEPWLLSRAHRRSAESERLRSRLARLVNRAELEHALGR